MLESFSRIESENCENVLRDFVGHLIQQNILSRILSLLFIIVDKLSVSEDKASEAELMNQSIFRSVLTTSLQMLGNFCVDSSKCSRELFTRDVF